MKWRSLQFLIFLIIWRFWLWFRSKHTYFQWNINRTYENHDFPLSNESKSENVHCKHKLISIFWFLGLRLQWKFHSFHWFDCRKPCFSMCLFILYWKNVLFCENHSQNLHIIKNIKKWRNHNLKIFNKASIILKILKILKI